MKTINTTIFLKMLESANNNLSNNVNLMNNLNVFPVPDGDTGSNMFATFSSAFGKIRNISSKESISKLFKYFSKELLLSARGNSGVILSQIFKGFSLGIKDTNDLNVAQFILGLEGAYKTSYKSVIKPVEGTILTVIKDSSVITKKIKDKGIKFDDFFKDFSKIINESLENTPNLLPILKELNVIDSGAKGLVVIFEGMISAFNGKIIPIKKEESNSLKSNFLMSQEIFNGEFGFCTEFILLIPKENSTHSKGNNFFKAKPFDKQTFLDAIKKMHATSEVVVFDEDILKVHCHIVDPFKLLAYAKKFGEFYKVKIDNMNEQTSLNSMNANNNHNIQTNTDKNIQIGIISCNNGQGIINDVKSYGAHFIIEGGQTMNPSAGDFVSAINTLNAKEIIIFPNNSNVILAAKQAAKISKDKKVVVLPTKTQIEGISAMIHYNDEESLQDNISEMESAISEVKSIAITKAIRNTKINKIKIKQSNYIAILDGKIVSTNESRVKIAIDLIKKEIDDMSGIITIYIGGDASIGDAKEISTTIESECDIEVVIKNGLQPTYDFLISIE